MRVFRGGTGERGLWKSGHLSGEGGMDGERVSSEGRAKGGTRDRRRGVHSPSCGLEIFTLDGEDG